MKIGSLVETTQVWSESMLKYKVPVPGEVYTVRAIVKGGRIGLLLEEVVNPKDQFNEEIKEPSWNIKYFRELQPPMNIEALIQECQCIEVTNVNQ